MKAEFKGEMALFILEHLNAGVVCCNEEGIIIYCNKYFEKICGFKREELLGKDVTSYHKPESAGKVKNILKHLREGKWEYIQNITGFKMEHYRSIFSPVIDSSGVGRGICMLIYDVSADERIKEELRIAAQTDAMTGLLNRMSFNQAIENIKEHFCSGTCIVLIMVDINGLKIINDEMGHAEGDFIIRKCSQVLQDSVRKDDIIFRIGGDEFVVLMMDARQKEGELVASRIKGNCSEWNKKAEKPFLLLVSVGVATAATRGEVETLLYRTDQAMYGDKKRFYDEREGTKFYGILR